MGRIYSRVVYAALGDSMSIDDYAGGRGRGAASLVWRNRDHDFPDWAGHDLTTIDPTARLVLLASDGATSTTVAGEQLGRLRRLGVVPTLATVTMRQRPAGRLRRRRRRRAGDRDSGRQRSAGPGQLADPDGPRGADRGRHCL
jgi:hypothetical protein